jgi:hypothetical protein
LIKDKKFSPIPKIGQMMAGRALHFIVGYIAHIGWLD